MKHLKETLAAQGVHTLIAQFTDIHGVAKGKLVPFAHLDALLTEGVGFSGPSIWGTGLPRTGPRSEYYGRGSASTARTLPWMPGHARIACDGFVAGEPFDACPRQVLRRQVAHLAERGWVLHTGIEPEFFLLQRTERGLAPADAQDRLDKPSYDLKSLPRQHEFLTELAAGLNACGLDVLQIDHEDAQGQFELNFHHADALTSADNLMLFKMAAQALAEKHGALFSMMPKPFANQPGSGMHFHVSLWDTDSEERPRADDIRRPLPEGVEQGGKATFAQEPRCLFRDPAGDHGLTPLALHFIAGVLAHSAALCAIAAPTVNSYKRLVVGESLSGTTWAPACVAHGPNNRTALVRTLANRFEWRLPDASANPYLATAALIAAGLDGIDRELPIGAACTDDLFAMQLPAILARGIALLPQSLGEAITALQQDEVVCDALGGTLSEQFIHLKRSEWTEYARHVSDWEQQRYGTMF